MHFCQDEVLALLAILPFARGLVLWFRARHVAPPRYRLVHLEPRMPPDGDVPRMTVVYEALFRSRIAALVARAWRGVFHLGPWGTIRMYRRVAETSAGPFR